MAQKKLHSGAKWLFRVEAFFITLFFVGFMAGFLFQFVWINLFGSILLFILCILILIVVITEVYAKLSYKFWAYEFTKDQLRVEKGIIWKRYSNIPYQRIQNVDITRGIIARLCGFSTVNIQTAGYSMPSGRGNSRFSEGYIPAVSVAEAERIREFVVKRINGKKGSGL